MCVQICDQQRQPGQRNQFGNTYSDEARHGVWRRQIVLHFLRQLVELLGVAQQIAPGRR